MFCKINLRFLFVPKKESDSDHFYCTQKWTWEWREDAGVRALAVFPEGPSSVPSTYTHPPAHRTCNSSFRAMSPAFVSYSLAFVSLKQLNFFCAENLVLECLELTLRFPTEVYFPSVPHMEINIQILLRKADEVATIGSPGRPRLPAALSASNLFVGWSVPFLFSYLWVPSPSGQWLTDNFVHWHR